MAKRIKQIGIDGFLSRINANGIASPNRYWTEFVFPVGIIETDGGNAINENLLWQNNPEDITSILNSDGRLSIMCSASQMPGRSLMTTEHKHANFAIKIPHSVMYDTISFSFTLSENLKERRFFELWQESVVNVEDGTMNFYDEYVSTIHAYQLDKNNNVTYAIDVFEAFPLSISNVDHSYGSQNEILTCSVTFAYKYWKNKETGIMTFPDQDTL